MPDKNQAQRQFSPCKPSNGETEILQILWDKQPCSVRAVHEQICATKPVGYTTILKQLSRMLDKGLVTRTQGAGKSYDYCAAQTQGRTQSTLIAQLLRTAFGGNVNQLVMHALGDSKASSQDLDALKHFIEKIETNASDGDPDGDGEK